MTRKQQSKRGRQSERLFKGERRFRLNRLKWSSPQQTLNDYARSLGLELVDCGECIDNSPTSRELLREAFQDMKRTGSTIGLAAAGGLSYVMVRRLPAADEKLPRKSLLSSTSFKPSPPGRT